MDTGVETDTDVEMVPAGEGSSSAVVVGPSEKKRKPFEIKEWNVFPVWAWSVACEAKQANDTSTKCTIAVGVCNHPFHFHCISQWLKIHPVCPLDNSA